jgi:hypothetical protein
MIVPSLPRLKMLILTSMHTPLNAEDALLVSSGLAYYSQNIEDLSRGEAREFAHIEELSCKRKKVRRGR